MTDPTPPDVVDAILRYHIAKVDPNHPAVTKGQHIGAWFVHAGRIYFTDHGFPYVEDAAIHLARLANV